MAQPASQTTRMDSACHAIPGVGTPTGVAGREFEDLPPRDCGLQPRLPGPPCRARRHGSISWIRR
jgi:hypothetical protein